MTHLKYGAYFSNYINRVHAQHHYERDFQKLAISLGIPTKAGHFSRTGYFPRPIITVERSLLYSEKTFKKMHEIGHVLLVDCGLEAQLLAEAENPEEAEAWVEAYCNFAAAQLQIPNPQYRMARGLHGDHPRTILHMLDKEGIVSLKVASRRFTYGELEEEAERAAFLLADQVVQDVASANIWVPFRPGHVVRDVKMIFPDAKPLLISERDQLVLVTLARK